MQLPRVAVAPRGSVGTRPPCCCYRYEQTGAVELAVVLMQEHGLAEAMIEANAAVELDPTHPAGHSLRGRILKREGKRGEAEACYRRAITLSVDAGEAMTGLLDCCHTILERRQAVNFIREQLLKNIVYGDGLLVFRSVAASVLGAEELLAALRTAWQARPDFGTPGQR